MKEREESQCCCGDSSDTEIQEHGTYAEDSASSKENQARETTWLHTVSESSYASALLHTSLPRAPDSTQKSQNLTFSLLGFSLASICFLPISLFLNF